MTANRPQYESRASGVPTIINDANAYIGCRTTPYSPVEITGCCASTVIVAPAYSFWLMTTTAITIPTATRMSPSTTTGNGTCDHPYRWSSALTTDTASTVTT